MTQVEYPECEKWAASPHRDIEAFTEFLDNKGIYLVKVDSSHGRYDEWDYDIQNEQEIRKLIYEFCKVDPTNLEQERRVLLLSARNTGSLVTSLPQQVGDVMNMVMKEYPEPTEGEI